MQTERSSIREAGNRKAKRWGSRWPSNRSRQGEQSCSGQPDPARSPKAARSSQPRRAGFPNRATSQIEPARAHRTTKSSQPGRVLSQPGRQGATRAARSSQPRRAGQPNRATRHQIEPARTMHPERCGAQVDHTSRGEPGRSAPRPVRSSQLSGTG